MKYYNKIINRQFLTRRNYSKRSCFPSYMRIEPRVRACVRACVCYTPFITVMIGLILNPNANVPIYIRAV